LTERFIKQLRKLPVEDCVAVNEALVSMLDAWGSPHAHRGAGIRKLGFDLFDAAQGFVCACFFTLIPSRKSWFSLKLVTTKKFVGRSKAIKGKGNGGTGKLGNGSSYALRGSGVTRK
jgi:hypothetical protein